MVSKEVRRVVMLLMQHKATVDIMADVDAEDVRCLRAVFSDFDSLCQVDYLTPIMGARYKEVKAALAL